MKYEEDLAEAKSNLKLRKNKRHFADSTTGEIVEVDCIKYLADRNEYIKQHNQKIGTYRLDVYEATGLEAKRIQEIDRFCITGSFPGENESNRRKDITIIGYFRALEKFLGGTYLIPVAVSAYVEKSREKDFFVGCELKREKIRAVYGKLNSILFEIESSDHYNFIPGTCASGKDYYNSSITKIEEEALRFFIGEDDILDRLMRVIEEERILVNSYSEPGVADRWRQINPRINYFDAVYDFMEREPELYKLIESGALKIKFCFYPTARDIRERKQYFYGIKRENEKNNTGYSETRFYQNEVIRTLRLVMEHDFPELKFE